MSDVDNPKRLALERLAAYVSGKVTDLGFIDTYTWDVTFGCQTAGTEYTKNINSPDTWSSTLADDQAAGTKTDIDALGLCFTSLSSSLSSAAKSLPATVDSDSPEARWPRS